jgi:hypothetical protein
VFQPDGQSIRCLMWSSTAMKSLVKGRGPWRSHLRPSWSIDAARADDLDGAAPALRFEQT